MSPGERPPGCGGPLGARFSAWVKLIPTARSPVGASAQVHFWLLGDESVLQVARFDEDIRILRPHHQN